MNNFNPKWITAGADNEMVTFADEIAKAIKFVSRTKFRNIYGEIKRIEMAGYEKEKTSFVMLRPKVVYLYAREKGSKSERPMETFKNVFEQAHKQVKDETTYRNFCNLMEAILAYHRNYSKN